MFSALIPRSTSRLVSNRPRRRRGAANATRLSLERLESRTMLAADVTNLGLAAVSGSWQADGELVAFNVSEFNQSADLNGDGDMFDNVLHLYDAANNTATNLGLTTFQFKLEGNLIAFTVGERLQGDVDLNGDGDFTDSVMHIYDATTGTVTNLGIAASLDLRLNDGLLVFPVSELEQNNADLNGDGDTNDLSLHVYDTSTGTITNLEKAIYFLHRSYFVEGSLVAFAVPESDQGNTDLNADGDTSDTGILHVYDTATGTTTNLGVAHAGFEVSAELVALSVPESEQGNTDLNGDGDADDRIIHVYDPISGSTTNLGVNGQPISAEGPFAAFLATGGARFYDANTGVLTNLGLNPNGQWSSVVGGRFAFNVHEGAAGNVDLNGDGDTTDANLIHVYDAATGVLTGLGLNGFFPQIAGNLVAFNVFESEGHGDLNGDGDAFDTIMHVHDLATGITNNLGLDARFVSQLDGTMIAFTVPESRQGNTDLNGDGDASDTVLHVYDAATGATTNLGLAADPNRVPRLSDKRVAFAVSESDHGATDLNGDGDTSDVVMHVAGFTVKTVEIDVQPHRDDNMLNLASNGMISVAVFTNENFDATQIDVSTVEFAGAFAQSSMLVDVDHDGDLDMVLRFRVQDTVLDEVYAQLIEGDLDEDGILDDNHQTAEVSLTGETLDDSLFGGSDTMDLFLTGSKLRDLLDVLAAAQLL